MSCPSCSGSDTLFRSGICGCLGECSLERFPEWLNHPEVDLLEWRMDKFAGTRSPAEMKSFCEALRVKPRLPLIATNRPVRQMGDFDGPEDLRLGMLEEAAGCGADWVDLEHDTSEDNIARFKKTGARVLLSWHAPAGTPSTKILRAKLEDMCKTGADALKIATLAQSADDNLRVLELIPIARKEFGIDLVAFCMGALGKWSRPASIFMGSPWTYAQLEGQFATAPGQFSAAELRALIRALM
ncbi:MAG: type I 3-dehydroquinate dehydratase [Deltaproteobacteria bacterium]|nr:type I 3-dehydroquinate dehydratase [Deltaproteobacteria bacterium]